MHILSKGHAYASIWIIFGFSFQYVFGYIFLNVGRNQALVCVYPFSHLFPCYKYKIILWIWRNKEINTELFTFVLIKHEEKTITQSYGDLSFIMTNIWTKVKNYLIICIEWTNKVLELMIFISILVTKRACLRTKSR